MVSRPRTSMPSISTLIAFQTAARLGNFSRAAEELRTSQSAVSRHIAGLEERMSSRVFQRSRTGVRLTEAGKRLYEAVVSGLGAIELALGEASEAPDEQHVTIACSHDAWQLLFMPRLDSLRDALGGNSPVRFSLRPGDRWDASLDSDADLAFSWGGRDAGPERLSLREAVEPVCSPDYAARNSAILEESVQEWGGITLLDSPMPDRRWASWEDWFEASGRPNGSPRMAELGSYGDVLRAASAGQGIALGWRYWVERHIEAGVLVPLGGGPVELDNFYCGLLTVKGRRKPLAHDCLAFLTRAFQD